MSQFDGLFGAVLRLFGARALYGLNVRFGSSPDGDYHYEADPRTGEIVAIAYPTPDLNDLDEAGRVKPDSASARREAAARLIAAMANHVALDSASAKEAARAAAIRRGANTPQSGAEQVMATSLRSSGRRFEDTDLVIQRMAAATHEETIAGVQAYLNHEEGNEVTEDLRREYGDNRSEAFRTSLQNVLAREADFANPDSGVNPNQRAISEFLAQYGYQPSSVTRAIAANPVIRALPRGLQKAAFEGTWQAIQDLQRAVESMLDRKLSEDEAIQLWQEFAAILPAFVNRFISRSE